MEKKLLTTRELKVGEFYTYRSDDEKEKNLSRVGHFTNSTSGRVDMIYVVREVVFGKGQKKLEVISLENKYSVSDGCANKTAETKYISLEKGERDLDRPIWYLWNDHKNIDMWFSDAGCVLDRKLKRAFPEYKMCAPNMMFGDIVVEVNTGIILSIDKVIGGHIISRLYYDKEKVLSNQDKYLILRKSDSRFRQAMKCEISLLSKNLPIVKGSTEEDSMYLDYLRTVLDNKLNSRVMQRLEAGCTFKVCSETFIGPGMYLCNGERIPILEFGNRVRFKEITTSSYPICSVTVSNSVMEFTRQLNGNVGRFDLNCMKYLPNLDDNNISSHFRIFQRENFHGYLVNMYHGIIVRYENEKSVHDYLQTKPSIGNPRTGGPSVSRLKYNGPGNFEIISNSFYQEIVCNGPWRIVERDDVPMLDEIFEHLEKSGRKKVVERPITVLVNGKEVKVEDRLMKELKKLVKE